MVIGLVALVVIVFTLITYFQFVSFGINFLGEGGSYGFWTTGNFWAWILMMLIIGFSFWVIKVVAVLFNRSVMGIKTFTVKDETFGKQVQVTKTVAITLTVMWIIVSFPITTLVMEFFAEHSDYTEWFVAGNWFAVVATYLAVLGLLNRFKVNDNQNS